MPTIYPAVPNSPQTQTGLVVSATDTLIPLNDPSVLPDAPNLAVLGIGSDSETVLYAAKTDGGISGVTRGFDGTTAPAWPAGTLVARNFTA